MIVEPTQYPHPRMAARWFKAHPHLACPSHERVIWVDSNMEITSPCFTAGALAAMRNGLAVWQHPQRDCIFDEARVCEQLAKYDGLPQGAQVTSYAAEGFRRHAGLYALGTMAWDVTDPAMQKLGEAWFAEGERWQVDGRPTIDQLSFPVVCWRLGVKPGTFPLRQVERRMRVAGMPWLANRWLRIWPHAHDL